MLCYVMLCYVKARKHETALLHWKDMDRIVTTNEPAHEIMVLITDMQQRMLRRACSSTQSHQSLRFSHTWSMEVDEGPDQKLDT